MELDKAPDRLAQLMLDDKIKGASYNDIAFKHDLPVDVVVTTIKRELDSATIKDPVEYRKLLQLRLEKLIATLWEAVDNGQFKSADTIVNAIDRIQELHALNEQQNTIEINIISDAQVAQLLSVLSYAFSFMYSKIASLPLTDEARNELDAWNEWTAEAATEAVEAIDAELVED